MPNTYLDRAIEAAPKFGDRISLFTKKLRLAQYADSSIYNYRLKIAQAVLYLKKLPDDFTQADVDDYLSMLLDRNRYSISHFKHTVFGLKDYYKVMGLKEPKGLVLPKVRKAKRLPRVLSQEQVARLIHMCDLYDKALLSTIYDCALRVSEACSLKWDDISFERQQLFVYQGKGKKDRIVPISSQLLILLRIFKKRFPSDDFVFKSHGQMVGRREECTDEGLLRPLYHYSCLATFCGFASPGKWRKPPGGTEASRSCSSDDYHGLSSCC